MVNFIRIVSGPLIWLYMGYTRSFDKDSFASACCIDDGLAAGHFSADEANENANASADV